jgi:CheY-like chemotaxis protein
VSEQGKGSIFTFTIPYKNTHSLHQQPLVVERAPNIKLSHKIILIVEDDPFNDEFLKIVLSITGATILQVEDGEEAVKVSLAQSIDLILMDIRLPGINGFEATRQIHGHKPKLKIIAQTAYASFDDRQKAADAGCIDYISKPIDKDDLLSMIYKHLT